MNVPDTVITLKIKKKQMKQNPFLSEFIRWQGQRQLKKKSENHVLGTQEVNPTDSQPFHLQYRYRSSGDLKLQL
jgi:hypothetical protein